MSLVMVGITSLVGVADRIISLPRPLMRLRPPQSVTGRASSDEMRSAPRFAHGSRFVLVAGSGGRSLISGRGGHNYHYAQLVAGSGGRMLISGRCSFSSVCSSV